MISGGTYGEVGRWLTNFLTSHAKRERLDVEVEPHPAGARPGASYALCLRLGIRLSEPLLLEFEEVAAQRGRREWCDALARRVREMVSRLAGEGPMARPSAP